MGATPDALSWREPWSPRGRAAMVTTRRQARRVPELPARNRYACPRSSRSRRKDCEGGANAAGASRLLTAGCGGDRLAEPEAEAGAVTGAGAGAGAVTEVATKLRRAARLRRVALCALVHVTAVRRGLVGERAGRVAPVDRGARHRVVDERRSRRACGAGNATTALPSYAWSACARSRPPRRGGRASGDRRRTTVALGSYGDLDGSPLGRAFNEAGCSGHLWVPAAASAGG